MIAAIGDQVDGDGLQKLTPRRDCFFFRGFFDFSSELAGGVLALFSTDLSTSAGRGGGVTVFRFVIIVTFGG